MWALGHVGRVGVGVGPSQGGHDSSVLIEIVSRAGLLINMLVNMTPILYVVPPKKVPPTWDLDLGV